MAARTLWIGDAGHPEFVDAAQDVRAAGSACFAASAAEAEKWLAETSAPLEVIVVAQSFSGQHDMATIDAIRGRAPLARVVALLGSWSEGEMRVGRPLTGVRRVRVSEWPAFWSREGARARVSGTTAWSEPVTTGDDERLLAFAAETPALDGHALVYSEDIDAARTYADALRAAGMEANTVHPRELPKTDGTIDVLLWDVRSLCERDREALSTAIETLRPQATIAIVGFPRTGNVQQLKAVGVTAVLARPLVLADLYETVANRLRTAAH